MPAAGHMGWQRSVGMAGSALLAIGCLIEQSFDQLARRDRRSRAISGLSRGSDVGNAGAPIHPTGLLSQWCSGFHVVEPCGAHPRRDRMSSHRIIRTRRCVHARELCDPADRPAGDNDARADAVRPRSVARQARCHVEARMAPGHRALAAADVRSCGAGRVPGVRGTGHRRHSVVRVGRVAPVARVGTELEVSCPPADRMGSAESPTRTRMLQVGDMGSTFISIRLCSLVLGSFPRRMACAC